MREISFGPVSNPDGTPTEFTKQMLGNTGRSLTPPFENRCPRFDFVTSQQCILEENHKDNDPTNWHRLDDKTAFAIGYTAEDAAEWDQAYNDPFDGFEAWLQKQED